MSNRKPIMSVLAGDILSRATRAGFKFKPGQFRRMCETVDPNELVELNAMAKHLVDSAPFIANLTRILKQMDDPKKEKETTHDDDTRLF